MTELEQALITELNNQNIQGNTWAMIYAQCKEESANFTETSENFHYTDPERLLLVFHPHVRDREDAVDLINKGEQAIANRVYANREGNGDEASGDGWRYRGGGLIQLTFKDNYAFYSLKCDIDILTEPELIRQPNVAARVAIEYFKQTTGLMHYAAQGNVLQCTRLINGGTNGLAERTKQYNLALINAPK
jgi:putative chitinase